MLPKQKSNIILALALGFIVTTILLGIWMPKIFSQSPNEIYPNWIHVRGDLYSDAETRVVCVVKDGVFQNYYQPENPSAFTTRPALYVRVEWPEDFDFDGCVCPNDYYVEIIHGDPKDSSVSRCLITEYGAAPILFYHKNTDGSAPKYVMDKFYDAKSKKKD